MNLVKNIARFKITILYGYTTFLPNTLAKSFDAYEIIKVELDPKNPTSNPIILAFLFILLISYLISN